MYAAGWLLGVAQALLRMRSELRWTVVVMVLAVAGVIALWPRPTSPAGPIPAPPEPVLVDRPDDAALASARAAAGLRPCPITEPGGPPGRGPLAAVRVPCLGAPGMLSLGHALARRACREEIPVLTDYNATPGAIAVLGVNVRDQPTAALALTADLSMRYPSVTDPDHTLQSALGRAPSAVQQLDRAPRRHGRVDHRPAGVSHPAAGDSGRGRSPSAIMTGPAVAPARCAGAAGR